MDYRYKKSSLVKICIKKRHQLKQQSGTKKSVRLVGLDVHLDKWIDSKKAFVKRTINDVCPINLPETVNKQQILRQDKNREEIINRRKRNRY